MREVRGKTGDSCSNAFALGEELPPDCKFMIVSFRKKINFYPANTFARCHAR